MQRQRTLALYRQCLKTAMSSDMLAGDYSMPMLADVKYRWRLYTKVDEDIARGMLIEATREVETLAEMISMSR